MTDNRATAAGPCKRHHFAVYLGTRYFGGIEIGLAGCEHCGAVHEFELYQPSDTLKRYQEKAEKEATSMMTWDEKWRHALQWARAVRALPKVIDGVPVVWCLAPVPVPLGVLPVPYGALLPYNPHRLLEYRPSST